MASNPCEAGFAEIAALCKADSALKRGRLLRDETSAAAVPGENEPSRQKRLAEASLARAEELLHWERMTASSAHSPGPVADTETLRRALREEKDFDVSGGLASSAFSDLHFLGLSVYRCAHHSVVKSRDEARKMQTPEKTYRRYVEIDVAWLRAQTVNLAHIGQTVRSLGVFDTAGPGEEAHAEVFVIAKHSGSVPLKDLQTDLMKLCANQVQEWPALAA